MFLTVFVTVFYSHHNTIVMYKFMQKTIATLFCAFSLLSATSAQVTFAVGAKGGLQLSNVHTTQILADYAPDFRFSKGATAGLVSEIGFGKYFALQPELIWVQKGFTWNEGIGVEISNIDVPIGVRASFRTNYLDIPVLAKAKFGQGVVSGYVVAGPSVGYAFDATLITRPRLFFELDPIKTDINLQTLNYKRWEVQGVIGAGINIKAGPLAVFADARYTRGFTELYDFPLINEKIKNHSMSLTAGVMVPITKTKKAVVKQPVRRYAPRP
jgi:hypothetical protein